MTECRYCHKPIVWVDGKPFDAKNWAGNWKAAEVSHFVTCSYYIRKREKSNCPACKLLSRGVLRALFEIDADQECCRMHSVSSILIEGRTIPTVSLHNLKKDMIRERDRAQKREKRLLEQGYLRGLDGFG